MDLAAAMLRSYVLNTFLFTDYSTADMNPELYKDFTTASHWTNLVI